MDILFCCNFNLKTFWHCRQVLLNLCCHHVPLVQVDDCFKPCGQSAIILSQQQKRAKWRKDNNGIHQKLERFNVLEQLHKQKKETALWHGMVHNCMWKSGRPECGHLSTPELRHQASLEKKEGFDHDVLFCRHFGFYRRLFFLISYQDFWIVFNSFRMRKSTSEICSETLL